MKTIYVETGEVRPPDIGEWYMSQDGTVHQCACQWERPHPVRIMSRRVVSDAVAEEILRIIDNATSETT